MSKIQADPLEVTQALLDQARAARFNFGEDTALVAVQHMLQQTVDLFKTVVDMGLSVKNIFAVGKVYSNSLPVIRTLRDMGVTVVDTTIPPPGEFHPYFERDVDRLWRIAINILAQRRIKRILVLDDAGVCITRVPAEVLHRYVLCGVEQTSHGIFLFEEKPPRFAVISWARAAVKLEIGGPIFSQCFIDKFNTEFLHGGRVQGERVGIIGLGSIGKGVANFALQQGNSVTFYDPDPDLYIPQSLRGRIARLDSLEELMADSDYVLGCSGRNPFKGKWPMRHRPGIKLLSVSGGDQEFGPIIKDLEEKPGFAVVPDTWDIRSEHGPSGAVQIAYRGYPYTFVSRDIEAVPTRVVQLETGGLLAALMQARFLLDVCEKGYEYNSGIHRMSPEGQRFVYEKWLQTMKDQNINLAEIFSCNRGVLSAAQQDDWFEENTEPRSSDHYEPVSRIEETMSELVYQGYNIKAQVGA